MDVFQLRSKVLDDYHNYVKSFLKIQDDRIREFVLDELERGALWSDPLIQLNPAYEMGKTVSQLTSEGILHPLCEEIFQKNGRPFHLYHHQEQAIHAAARKVNYVLTTGTGSGKSLTYWIPIIDHILKNNPEPEQVRALIVYPMNPLINSQCNEINTLLKNLGEDQNTIRFGQYTGQVKGDARQQLQEHPPHILLTNYVMLELMMSRPVERVFLDRTLANLEFLVLDELHTYTGRQGADVSMLVRRVRQRCGNDDLRCIGTSATMVVGGTRDEQRKAVAKVTTKIFGDEVSPENVIDEMLKPSIQSDGEITSDVLTEAIRSPIPETLETFRRNPFAAWIEETFGIEKQEDYYKRRTPITFKEGAKKLSDLTDVDQSECEAAIIKMLLKGNQLKQPDDSPVFAVKLHQFISQGDYVYASIETPENRSLTLCGQHWTKGDDDKDILLAPLVFCRICGQEYYQVILNEHDGIIQPRLHWDSADFEDESISDGYLLIDEDEIDPSWSDERMEELPDNWFRLTKTGRSLKREYRPFIPRGIFVDTDGSFSEEARQDFVRAWFIKAPLLICPNCGEVYDKRTKDFAKLARLSSEGRSTATTLITLSTVTQMQKDSTIPVEAQKILSFTDNRQDASLQAGHFNDFIQIGLLRSAIYKALPEDSYLDYTNIATEIVTALDLTQPAYAINPGGIGLNPKRNLQAFTNYIEYRIYQDLRRGWRIVQPNLEQCGLLKTEYEGLAEVCEQEDVWTINPILENASTDERLKVARAFLNHLRRTLAIDVDCLKPTKQIALKKEANQTLIEPWKFDDDENFAEGKWFAFGNRRYGERSLSPISIIGKYLRSRRAWPALQSVIDTSSYAFLLKALVNILNQAGYLHLEEDGNDLRIQLQVNSMQWVKGAGTIEIDPVRSKRLKLASDELIQQEANLYFTEFYKGDTARLLNMEAKEHTGQTLYADREDREKRFHDGELPTLFCSPTMELGIDISDLNTVNMRNVPPTPANYAQRSGRAGRSGQPALISTYCSTWSGHDQYFYKRQPEMVAGVVVPPRLDLANEDMVKSHMHAVWLGTVNLDLKNSISDNIIDMNSPDLPLQENVQHQTSLSEDRIQECISACKSIIQQCENELSDVYWYSEEWLEGVIRNAAREFDKAFERWRELYKIADQQLEDAQETIRNAHQNRLSADEMKDAERRQREAVRQKDILCNHVKNRDDSDFYPYRYLASEGFLPGYNFPRLPVRAFIPREGKRDNYLSRSRFLAISEYGPRNVIYHEGRKYRVIRSMLLAGDPESRFTQAKICKKCGAFHANENLANDLCEHCRTRLDAENSQFIRNLFEMTTVATQRAERITCDEEERVKYGYDITTHFHFSMHEGKERKSVGQLIGEDGNSLLIIEFGPAAELLKINHGWRRSSSEGFIFDYSFGAWKKRLDDFSDTALDAGQERVGTGVKVFVKDTRNILLIKPTESNPLSEEILANLQHALHIGLSAVFQIDYSEIASNRIGIGSQRSILIWEAVEGGVGVLQRLIDEPDTMSRIANKALDICHFANSNNNKKEDSSICAKACYYCLMTYSNQRDHQILDRHLVKNILIEITKGKTQIGHHNRSYDEQYEWLRQQTDNRSSLEKELLDSLYRSGKKLPDAAQKFLQNVYSCPDFYYDNGYVCVFCDGSIHDEPHQKEEDKKIRNKLRNIGYRVIVIRYDRSMQNQIEENENVFSEVR